MIRMKRIELTLKARDLHETIGFYRDLLGFELDLLWPEESPTFCIMIRDKIRLMCYSIILSETTANPPTCDVN